MNFADAKALIINAQFSWYDATMIGRPQRLDQTAARLSAVASSR
jgi:hypothetical protein